MKYKAFIGFMVFLICIPAFAESAPFVDTQDPSSPPAEEAPSDSVLLKNVVSPSPSSLCVSQ